MTAGTRSSVIAQSGLIGVCPTANESVSLSAFETGKRRKVAPATWKPIEYP